ncbi:MAG: thiamine pyrophosphate-binding protein, partial [Alphaproteobacteria bacterium]|nr:thiamine pyrophosphate-binding protein [Alphaproteobacteria bacterium]
MPEKQITGGQALIEALIANGADTAFGVPGESYLAALDAFHDAEEQLKFITCRHEAGAANMAEAYGKMTGKPGICFVTRGPGATHATIGLHTAFQDSTPMIMFIGQVAADQVEREAFQEIDYRRFLSEVTKWTAEINDASRMAEYVGRAFRVATSGRPGPVA